MLVRRWICNKNRQDILERKDQSSLLLGHLGLKTTLVESLSHGSDAAARASPCDQTSSALQKLLVLKTWQFQLLNTYQKGCDGSAGAQCHNRSHFVDVIRSCRR